MSCDTLQDALSAELTLHAKDIITVKQLILNGADVNYQSSDGWCLLFELVSLGLSKHLIQLKQYGLDIDVRDFKGRNALFWAIYHENVDVLESLIHLGYNLDLNVTAKLPALHYAVYKNNSKIVNTLLSHSYDLNRKDMYEQTALDYAYYYNRQEMITLLKKWGASTANLGHMM